MSRCAHSYALSWSTVLRSAFVVLFVMSAGVAFAQAPDGLIQAHVDAGEFAPAMAMARGIADPARQNAWLARIAAAQARAGARPSAFRSLAEISDDRARGAAVDRVAAQPLGGGANADFDSLIDLITSTVQPTTWDGVGGAGSIAPFPTGVDIDAAGVIGSLLTDDRTTDLTTLRETAAPGRSSQGARRNSPLRKVSLPRLEKHVQLCLADGRQPTEAMQLLAGLTRIEYVFVYPDTGDLVIAGPAGDWVLGKEGRVVNADSNQPVLRLDDLVVLLRHTDKTGAARFGCMINPRQENLARAQAFLKESAKRSIDPRDRPAWLERLRSSVGRQDVEVYGIDSRTRVAQVMVEADYRMKLVGMGIEEGVPGVTSYLDLIEIPPGGSPPPMGVLRWWFTLNYDAVTANTDRKAFAIRGQGVKVLSENERLAADGQRIHTGQSEALNRQFAQSFTRHFAALCRKYPVYAELRNVCDLALVAALMQKEGLADRVRCHKTCFGDGGAYQVKRGVTPTHTETVINHRVIRRKHIIAGVSGGVRVDPAPLVVRSAIDVMTDGPLSAKSTEAAPEKLSPQDWWWD